MSADLIVFLTARLDDDEADAADAAQSIHFPADRLRAEVAAKRAILEDAARMAEARQDLVAPSEVFVRHLASIYADHPDYRAEWRP